MRNQRWLLPMIPMNSGLLFVLLGLTMGTIAPGYCLDKPVSGAAAMAPTTNSGWVPTGNLNTARAGHTATLLPDGKVLVAGGIANNSDPLNFLDSAELYDPALNTWSSAGGLNSGHYSQTATLLPNGKVLVAGGFISTNV